jgi:hypothetical protein
MTRIQTIIALLFATPFLNACISTDEIMRSWIGSSIDQVIVSWGAPARTMTLDNGDRLVEFHNYAPQNLRPCAQTFIASADGIIKSWRHSGCNKYNFK